MKLQHSHGKYNLSGIVAVFRRGNNLKQNASLQPKSGAQPKQNNQQETIQQNISHNQNNKASNHPITIISRNHEYITENYHTYGCQEATAGNRTDKRSDYRNSAQSLCLLAKIIPPPYNVKDTAKMTSKKGQPIQNMPKPITNANAKKRVLTRSTVLLKCG